MVEVYIPVFVSPENAKGKETSANREIKVVSNYRAMGMRPV